MKIDINSPYPGVIHLRFSNQYELASTFLRLQEFYESPLKGIKGRYFTLDHYMDLYAKEYGNFTYTMDWNGFNVPGNVIESFIEIFSGNLLPKEEELLSKLPSELGSDNKFYVIGTWGDAQSCLDHELAHAFYYLDLSYKKGMNKLIKAMDAQVDEIYIVLKNMGYCKTVLKDELQAYLATSDDEYLTGHFPRAVIGRGYIMDIQKFFKSYFSKI